MVAAAGVLDRRIGGAHVLRARGHSRPPAGRAGEAAALAFEVFGAVPLLRSTPRMEAAVGKVFPRAVTARHRPHRHVGEWVGLVRLVRSLVPMGSKLRRMSLKASWRCLVGCPRNVSSTGPLQATRKITARVGASRCLLGMTVSYGRESVFECDDDRRPGPGKVPGHWALRHIYVCRRPRRNLTPTPKRGRTRFGLQERG